MTLLSSLFYIFCRCVLIICEREAKNGNNVARTVALVTPTRCVARVTLSLMYMYIAHFKPTQLYSRIKYVLCCPCLLPIVFCVYVYYLSSHLSFVVSFRSSNHYHSSYNTNHKAIVDLIYRNLYLLILFIILFC